MFEEAGRYNGIVKSKNKGMKKTKVLVTGITGKSGLFFYEELRKNVEKLQNYEFDFIVRNKVKAERLLNAKGLNQNLWVGSLDDKSLINSMLLGGVRCSSYSGHWLF